jgi:hypothetical protein
MIDSVGAVSSFNGGIVFVPDLTTVDERTISANVAPVIIQTTRAYGLYVWIAARGARARGY